MRVGIDAPPSSLTSSSYNILCGMSPFKFSFFYKDASHTGVGPILMTSLHLDGLGKKPCFQIKSHSKGLGVRNSTSLFRRGHN